MSEPLTDDERREIHYAFDFGRPLSDVDDAVERIIATRLAAAEARAEAGERKEAAVEALAERWRALPVWGPDERGLHILDGVDHEGLMRELRAALDTAAEEQA